MSHLTMYYCLWKAFVFQTRGVIIKSANSHISYLHAMDSPTCHANKQNENLFYWVFYFDCLFFLLLFLLDSL